MIVSGSLALHVGCSGHVCSCRMCVVRKELQGSFWRVSVQRKSNVKAETKMFNEKSRDVVTTVVMMQKKRWKSTFCGEKAVLFLSHVQHARCSLAVVRRVLSCFSDCATTDLPTASQR